MLKYTYPLVNIYITEVDTHRQCCPRSPQHCSWQFYLVPFILAFLTCHWVKVMSHGRYKAIYTHVNSNIIHTIIYISTNCTSWLWILSLFTVLVWSLTFTLCNTWILLHLPLHTDWMNSMAYACHLWRQDTYSCTWYPFIVTLHWSYLFLYRRWQKLKLITTCTHKLVGKFWIILYTYVVKWVPCSKPLIRIVFCFY